jgi:hypothetical protein
MGFFLVQQVIPWKILTWQEYSLSQRWRDWKDIPECNEETGFMLSYLYSKMP